MQTDGSVQLKSYDDVADEYYDEECHPTSAAFRRISMRWIADELENSVSGGVVGLEIGAGKAILPILLKRLGISIDKLVVSDKSAKMLRANDQSPYDNVKTVLADVLDDNFPFKFGKTNFNLIVSSLGDPYNLPKMWSNLSQITSRTAVCLFTCPSLEWATHFRTLHQKGMLDVAEFATRDNSTVLLPSFIYNVTKQIKMAERSGFRLDRFDNILFSESALGIRAPKLSGAAAMQIPVLAAYRFRRTN